MALFLLHNSVKPVFYSLAQSYLDVGLVTLYYLLIF